MRRHNPCLFVSAAIIGAVALSTPASARVQQPGTDVPTAAINIAQRKAVIAKAISAIDANYVFPQKTPAIAAALNRLQNSAAVATGDVDAFVRAVNDVLASAANDRHLRLNWSARQLPPAAARGETPDAAELARMQTMMARRNFGVTSAEVLTGNVGYLKIDVFARAQRAGPVLAAAMTFLQRADAMIVDVRDNGGGDPEMVAQTVSYLLPAQIEINRFHRRGQASDERIYTQADVPGGRWSTTKPVYVLTGRQTGSGAEEFAYDLQQLKRATIVGETTWGGANPGDVFPLDEHFALFVPTGAAVNPISGTNWEGVGVQPGIRTTAADALKTAHQLALKTLLAASTGDRAEELTNILAGKAGKR